MFGWQQHPGRSSAFGGSSRRICGNSTKRWTDFEAPGRARIRSIVLPRSTTVIQPSFRQNRGHLDVDLLGTVLGEVDFAIKRAEHLYVGLEFNDGRQAHLGRP